MTFDYDSNHKLVVSLKSERQSYVDALRRNTRIEGGALTADDRNYYARKIVETSGKLATVLGGMPW